MAKRASCVIAAIRSTISPSIPYAGNFAVAVYSNGDPFVAWDDKNHHLMGARYRVATSLWDADQTIDTYAATPDAAGAKASLAIDGSDHLTVAWTYFSNAGAAYHTAYRRDPGSGLGTHEELPGSSFASLVVDHVGTTYLLTREAIADAGANHVVVRRAGTSEATFGPAGDTGIVCPPDTPGSTPSPSAVSFDDDNEPIVVGLDANPSLSPANGVSATRCH